MSEHTAGACGCYVAYYAITNQPYIVHCPIHAAAPKLLAACEALIESGEIDWLAEENASLIRVAYAEARGEQS